MRLDLWLFTARFFKTRALAAAAVDAGRVELNGQPSKRGKLVKPGDELRIRLGPYQHHLTVLGLAPRRGPAAVAVLLYQETPESTAARERLAEQLRLAAKMSGVELKGRPTKRDRRDIERFRGKNG